MKDLIQNHGFVVSIVMMLFIILCATIGFFYIRSQKKNDKLLDHRGIIEMIPSFISTLGVLGTFLGITMGLYYFDTKDLTTSIPLLLSGLKTAFFTSLAGMVGSLILSGQVNKLFDEKTKGVSDINIAAGEIVNAVRDMSAANKQTIEELKRLTEAQSQNQTAFYNSALSSLRNMETKSGLVQNDVSSILLQFSSTNTSIESLLQSVGNVEEQSAAFQTASATILTQVGTNLTHMEHSIDEVMDGVSAMQSTQEDVANEVKAFGGKLHGEVLEIEDKMDETSNLLKNKFDEFAELLKKSNTEALVEVMKKVTEEFQSQMNALINKLIQENFEQLNNSVERLNTWQQENKEMIQSLTSQYKQMADNFEGTSTVLTKVGTDTQNLVSDGGKLEQLIDSLNEVIINDEKFKEISTNLQQTADLSKSNMESFDQSTRQLNDWVKKQRNFSDAVAVLIQKLEELNEIRNYASTFWKETKDGMNDAVGIVKNGSEQLNRQITGLDQQFYARLSTTLANLDACIQSLITNARNNR